MKFNHYRKSYQGWRRFSGKDEGFLELFSRHHRGGSREGFGGRGEGKRRFFERGEFKFALLELLATGPMHGYQLIKAMEEKTGGLYTPSAGSVYPNLQLLEELNLIGFSEEDGKKLYHITDEGKEHLRQREKADPERSENRWERRGRHGQSGRHGKHELREFMKEWSELIYLMAGSAKAAQENPSSRQAKEFRELMTKLQDDLKKIGDSTSAPASAAADESVTPPLKENPLTEDQRAGE